MARSTASFGDLLAPLPVISFLEDYQHSRPLHQRGRPDKFASVLSWPVLNDLLAMDVWTPQTLQLCLDTQKLPPAAYCQRTIDRNRQQIMRPDSQRVTDYLKRGATLLLNEVESLHPGVMDLVQAVSQALGAKVAANIYCSWRARPGFDSHYDRHDVYALQIAGRKRWRLYQGRVEDPIEHASFHNVPQADYDRMKGRVAQEVDMEPGDLLYIPRGQFHDALASSEASLHVTLSCSEMNGLDWLSRTWERLVLDSRFRAYLPRPELGDGEAALHAHLATLVEALRESALSEAGIADTRARQRGFTIGRNAYDLPNLGQPEEEALMPLRRVGRR